MNITWKNWNLIVENMKLHNITHDIFITAFYYIFTSQLHFILQPDYILSCNYYVIFMNYMKKSVPPISGNGGYRLFHVNSLQLQYIYTLEAKFYIQDVMFHVNFLIYKVIPSVLPRQCLPLHPGCNGHVTEI